MSGPVDWGKQGSQGYGQGPQGYDQGPQGYDQGPQGYDQGPQGYGPPPIPPTNAGWAVAATLFFWPLAFVAWTASSNVVRLWATGDLAGSRAASDQAKRMGKIALWIGIGVFVLFVVAYGALIAVIAAHGGFATTTTR